MESDLVDPVLMAIYLTIVAPLTTQTMVCRSIHSDITKLALFYHVLVMNNSSQGCSHTFYHFIL